MKCLFKAINREDNQRGIPIGIKNNLYFRFQDHEGYLC